MSSEILRLFEGLTEEQAKEFRSRIVPALTEIRDEIIKSANKISNAQLLDYKPDWVDDTRAARVQISESDSN